MKKLLYSDRRAYIMYINISKCSSMQFIALLKDPIDCNIQQCRHCMFLIGNNLVHKRRSAVINRFDSGVQVNTRVDKCY